MSPGKALTAMKRSLNCKDMTKNAIDLFDGFFFLLGGNFLSVLAVVKHGNSKGLEISEIILYVPFWRDIKFFPKLRICIPVMYFMQNGCFIWK